MFANVRLDVKEEEEVQYHSDIFSFNVSISTRRPDQSLGYQNSATGSNVYRMIQKFLKNTQVTLCGTLMYIVIKRYPNESDVSDIITQLRANNIFAYVVVHDFPSGGNNPGTLFDMSSKTNGYCIFDHGPNFWLAASQVAYPISSPNQFISHNYVVSGSGRIQIPAFQTPAPNSYGEQVLVAITCQNHTLDSSFISVNYTIQSLDGSWKFTGPDIGGDQGWWQEGTGIIAYPQINGSTSYTWTIDYHYANNEPQFIQARMYSYYYHDFLPLPSY
ncbi:hypothetical protein B9Z55_021051 [Caenorhabditis nigoni]|uniref:DUF7154 domain-containing protein n=1 Tax=Caenorhabditis nigoni TaxID=1611254 RepID=A0A2G5TQH0_9PELO|nr:hypothetical protein B9Z55_021051 [Caenorhabditis nigoni]